MNNTENLIEKVKILILYGQKLVDGENKDGKVEKIYREKNDTAHYFYIKDFLQNHMKDENDMQQVLTGIQDVNTVFYEIQKLGHIVFAENTSTPSHKTGVFYMSEDISENQRETLKKLKGQLEKEKYSILVLMNLHRDEEGILTGNQKQGSPKILDEFIKEEQER